MSSILVVEDEPDIAEGLSDVLRDEGHQVTVVHDGAAALQALEKGAFDLMITDMMMPRLDGAGLVSRVREHARIAQLPVIAMSAAPIDRATHTQVQLVLRKPFDVDAFLNAVEYVLRS